MAEAIADGGAGAPAGNDAPPAGNEPASVSNEDTEAAEWDAATDKLYPQLAKGKTDDTTQAGQDGKPNPQDPANKKPNEGKGDGNDAETPGEGAEGAGDNGSEAEQPDIAGITARTEARESSKQVAQLKSDIRSQLFKDSRTALVDAQGDEIKSIEDVMNLVNPNTGEGFTEEEAGAWFLQAQQKLNKEIESTNAEVDRIADLNLEIKDQADMIGHKYGELLKAMPDFSKKLYEKWVEGVEFGSDNQTIVNTKSSLESFYDVALEPYVELAKKLESQETAQAEAAAKAEQDAKAADQRRQASRADRSDIYSNGNNNIDDGADEEDKEWAAAEKKVFG